MKAQAALAALLLAATTFASAAERDSGSIMIGGGAVVADSGCGLKSDSDCDTFASAAERDDTDTTVTIVGCGEEWDCLLHYAPPLPRGDWVCNGSDPIFCGTSSWNVTDAGADTDTTVTIVGCGEEWEWDCPLHYTSPLPLFTWVCNGSDPITC